MYWLAKSQKFSCYENLYHFTSKNVCYLYWLSYQKYSVCRPTPEVVGYIFLWLVPRRFSWRRVKARVGWRECEQWGSDWQIGNPKWRPLQWRTQTLTMPIGTIFPGHCTRLLLCKWPFSFKFVTCVYNFIWYLILYTGLAGNMSLVT